MVTVDDERTKAERTKLETKLALAVPVRRSPPGHNAAFGAWSRRVSRNQSTNRARSLGRVGRGPNRSRDVSLGWAGADGPRGARREDDVDA